MDMEKDKDRFLLQLADDLSFEELQDLCYSKDANQFYSARLADWFVDKINYGWRLWQASKAKAVPEGFVLIEESKVKTWYQDDNEPENFCTSNNDFDVLGECLDHEDIIQVNKIQDAIIQTTPMYGVWKFKIIGGYPERDCFVLCGTEQEAESIRDEYRCMITPEAQEPTND